MQWAKKQTGFTIVELLIVIVVIAILAAITIVAYNGIQNRAKESAAQSTASQAAKKVALWQVANENQTPTPAEFNTITASVSTAATLQYTPGSSGAYCATVTTDGLSYYITNGGNAPVSGACFGHNVNGTTIITNLITNPSFESNVTAWTNSSNGAINHGTSGGLFGSRYLRMTRSGALAIGLYGPPIEVSPGDQYSGSISARYPAGRQVLLRMKWSDASGTVLAEPTGGTVTSTGGWQRLTISNLTVPAGAVSGRFDVVMNTVSAAAGDTLDIDGAMVTRGATTYTYADGNSAGWTWQDTVNNSASSGPAL